MVTWGRLKIFFLFTLLIGFNVGYKMTERSDFFSLLQIKVHTFQILKLCLNSKIDVVELR